MNRLASRAHELVERLASRRRGLPLHPLSVRVRAIPLASFGPSQSQNALSAVSGRDCRVHARCFLTDILGTKNLALVELTWSGGFGMSSARSE